MTTVTTLLTAGDFLAMPDDGKNYELVRGELVEMPPPGFTHELIVARFIVSFGGFVEQNHLGIVTTAPGIYIEQDPDTVRAPDCFRLTRAHYHSGAEPGLRFRADSRPGGGSGFARLSGRRGASPGPDVAGAGVRMALLAYIGAQEIAT